MATCTSAHLDHSFSGIRAKIVEMGEPEQASQLATKYVELSESFRPDAVGYCIDRFIVAELDFTTNGERGLGRVTTDTPRLGAHFRKSLSRLAGADRDRVYGLIQNLMLRGYLTYALFAEDPMRRSEVGADQLFTSWVPAIYSGRIPAQLEAVLGGASESAFNDLIGFFKDHGMRAGLFSSTDTIEKICGAYAVAGLKLRFQETALNS